MNEKEAAVRFAVGELVSLARRYALEASPEGGLEAEAKAGSLLGFALAEWMAESAGPNATPERLEEGVGMNFMHIAARVPRAWAERFARSMQ